MSDQMILEDGEDARLEATLRETHANLRDGGPAVDWHQMQQYHDGLLDENESAIVLRRIVTWRDWYDAQTTIIGISCSPIGEVATPAIGKVPSTKEIRKYGVLLRRTAIFGLAASVAILVGGYFWQSQKTNESKAPTGSAMLEEMAVRFGHLKKTKVDQGNASIMMAELKDFSLSISTMRKQYPDFDNRLILLVEQSVNPMATYLLNPIDRPSEDEVHDKQLEGRITLRNDLMALLKTGLGERLDPATNVPFLVRNALSHAQLGDVGNARHFKAASESAGVFQLEFLKSGETARDYINVAFFVEDYRSVAIAYEGVSTSKWCPDSWIQKGGPPAIGAYVKLGESNKAYELARNIVDDDATFAEPRGPEIETFVFVGYLEALRKGTFGEDGLQVCLDSFLRFAESAKQAGNPAADRMRAVVAEKLMLNGKQSLAIKIFESLEKSGDPYLAGSASAFLGKSETGAETLLAAANAIDDKSDDVFLSAINNYVSCLSKLNDNEELRVAIEQFEQLISAVDPGPIHSCFYGTVAESKIKLGQESEGLRWFGKAEALIATGSQDLSCSLAILSLHANALFDAGEKDRAVEMFARCIADAKNYFDSPDSVMVASLENQFGRMLQKVPSREKEGESLIARSKLVIERSKIAPGLLLLAAK